MLAQIQAATKVSTVFLKGRSPPRPPQVGRCGSLQSWEDNSLVFGLVLSTVRVKATTTGVKTDEVRKGKVLQGLADIWKVFFGSPPLHKS